MRRTPEIGPQPDYNDPFSPKKGSNRRLACLHCGATFNEVDLVWANRGGDWLWYCPTPSCGGAGIGYDLFEADSEMGKAAQETAAKPIH